MAQAEDKQNIQEINRLVVRGSTVQAVVVRGGGRTPGILKIASKGAERLKFKWLSPTVISLLIWVMNEMRPEDFVESRNDGKGQDPELSMHDGAGLGLADR